MGGLFHEDGYLAESVYREKVAKLLEQWEAAQHSGQAKKSS